MRRAKGTTRSRSIKRFLTEACARGPVPGGLVAVASVSVAVVARLALDPVLGGHDPFAVFYPAVAISVFFGRAPAGLLAIFLSMLAGDFLFVSPKFILGTKGPADATSVLLFLLGGGIVTAFGEAMQRARSRAIELSRSTDALEQQAREIIETAHEGIWIVDAEARIIMVNPRLCEMLGYSADEMRGCRKWDFLFPEDIAVAKELFQRRKRGLSDHTDYRFRSKDGREVWTLMAARPRFDANSRFCGALDMFSDITERKLAEDALRASETMLRIAQRAGGIGTFEWDIKSRQARGSETLFEIFGMEKINTVVSTEDWAKLIHPEDRSWMLSHLEQAAQGKEPCDAEYRIVRSDGEIRWLHYMGQLATDLSGKPSRLIGTVTDVTAAKQRERELETTVAERTTQLREMVNELEVFSYSIAHDMRAPLRAMQGLSKAVLEDFGKLLPPEGLEYLERIAGSANRLDRQILDVLSYSYLVRGNLPMDNIDLDSLVREILSCSPDLQQDSHATFEIPAALPVVWGNRPVLTQVLSNLLTNAVKFVAPGVVPHVRISARASDGSVKVSVRDNGIGIPAKSQQKIFGIFQRLHAPDAYDGTGIGLAIVKKAIDRMGGQVGVCSEPGKGSEFWFTLKPGEAMSLEPNLDKACAA